MFWFQLSSLEKVFMNDSVLSCPLKFHLYFEKNLIITLFWQMSVVKNFLLITLVWMNLKVATFCLDLDRITENIQFYFIYIEIEFTDGFGVLKIPFVYCSHNHFLSIKKISRYYVTLFSQISSLWYLRREFKLNSSVPMVLSQQTKQKIYNFLRDLLRGLQFFIILRIINLFCDKGGNWYSIVT